jgi:hypothetical protein
VERDRRTAVLAKERHGLAAKLMQQYKKGKGPREAFDARWVEPVNPFTEDSLLADRHRLAEAARKRSKSGVLFVSLEEGCAFPRVPYGAKALLSVCVGFHTQEEAAGRYPLQKCNSPYFGKEQNPSFREILHFTKERMREGKVAPAKEAQYETLLQSLSHDKRDGESMCMRFAVLDATRQEVCFRIQNLGSMDLAYDGEESLDENDRNAVIGDTAVAVLRLGLIRDRESGVWEDKVNLELTSEREGPAPTLKLKCTLVSPFDVAEFAHEQMKQSDDDDQPDRARTTTNW